MSEWTKVGTVTSWQTAVKVLSRKDLCGIFLNFLSVLVSDAKLRNIKTGWTALISTKVNHNHSVKLNRIFSRVIFRYWTTTVNKQQTELSVRMRKVFHPKKADEFLKKHLGASSERRFLDLKVFTTFTTSLTIARSSICITHITFCLLMKQMEKAIKFNRTFIVLKTSLLKKYEYHILWWIYRITSCQHSALLHYMYIYFTSTTLEG